MEEREMVEVVTRAFEAWNRGDIEGVLAGATPDFEWDMTRSDVPGMTRVYLGHEGYREFAESWRETLVPSQVEVIETRALGDGRLYALLRQTAIGPGSGVALDFDYVQINEFESGKICRAEVFTDLDKGRRAAGLD